MVIQIGKHTAHIEEDTLFFQIVGSLGLEEMHAYLRLSEQIESRYGYCFIVDDISSLGSAAPLVRRTIVNWFGIHVCAGAVLYGGSVTARTVAVLVVGAMKILRSQPCPIVFVKQEKEARDWVAIQRRKTSMKSADSTR